MNEDVEAAIKEWLPAFGPPVAPAVGVKDLKGRGIRIAKFTDEETLRFFFPRRSLDFQQRMVKRVAKVFRERGAKILSVTLTPEIYTSWIGSRRLEDTPARRFQFATTPPLF